MQWFVSLLYALKLILLFLRISWTLVNSSGVTVTGISTLGVGSGVTILCGSG
jgi:hypothetical protein